MSAEETVQAQLMLIVERFGGVCAAPDDLAVCGAADQALADLDALLAGTGA